MCYSTFLTHQDNIYNEVTCIFYMEFVRIPKKSKRIPKWNSNERILKTQNESPGFERIPHVNTDVNTNGSMA